MPRLTKQLDFALRLFALAFQVYFVFSFELFTDPRIDPLDLGDAIEEFLSTQLCTEPEDGSIDQVAELCVKMCNECNAGNYQTVTNLLSQPQHSGALQSSLLKKDEDEDNYEDIDVDEDFDEDEDEGDEDMVFVLINDFLGRR